MADISVDLGKFEDAEQNYLDAIRDIKEELGESFEPVELVQELANQLESLAVLKWELRDYSAGVVAKNLRIGYQVGNSIQTTRMHYLPILII